MKKRKRSSLLDKYKEEIKEYLEIGLSLRCIYLLINKKLKENNYHITYQGSPSRKLCKSKNSC